MATTEIVNTRDLGIQEGMKARSANRSHYNLRNKPLNTQNLQLQDALKVACAHAEIRMSQSLVLKRPVYIRPASLSLIPQLLTVSC